MDSVNRRENMNTPEPESPRPAFPDQLLTAKFIIPPSTPTHLTRPRLTTLLDAGLQQQVILVSAAAGFGKTALLSSWAHAFGPDGPPVAWLTRDTCDNVPTQFWTYVLATLERCWPGIATQPLTFLREGSQPAWQSMLTTLINTIARHDERVVLVLDNYDRITEPAIHALISFL